MGFRRSIDQFLEFRPDAYRAEISQLLQPELRDLHKRIQRKLVSAATQSALGVAGAAASGGLTLVFSGIGARHIDVNRQRCAVIEALLKERGWTGHDFGFTDLMVGAAPGADHIADQAISHVATLAAHHGTEQFAGQVQPTTFGGPEAAAVHYAAHIGIGQGTAWVLNNDSSPVLSTEQNSTIPSVQLGDGFIGHSQAQTMKRAFMLLLPALVCSILGLEFLWIALFGVFARLGFTRYAGLAVVACAVLLTFYSGVGFLCLISALAVVLDIYNRHSPYFHRLFVSAIQMFFFFSMLFLVGWVGFYIVIVIDRAWRGS